jgi:phage terminase large subunit-like protein
MEKFRPLQHYKPSPFMADGSKYKEKFADYAVYFINCLKHSKGRWAGQSFKLLDWQEQIIRNIFGIIIPTKNEVRQFRTAYIEIPKKQGKSELAAAVALLLTCTDNEPKGEIYGCATDRSQASIVFDVAVDMVDRFPELKREMKTDSRQKAMTYKPLGSTYKIISAESHNNEGYNPHGVIFDELHAQTDRKFFDIITKGSTVSREQPLTFIITTAGYDRNSFCYEMHRKAEDIISGAKIDPTFYPVMYSASAEDDWESEATWRKTNPSLGITFDMDTMRQEYAIAKENAANENIFRRLHLNQWVTQSERWMPMSKWDACVKDFDIKSLKGRKCYGGLDLSSTQDLTSFVLVFPPDRNHDDYIVLPYFWIPADTMATRIKRDQVPYDIWKASGQVFTTPGAAVDYSFIEAKILELSRLYNIEQIAYDPWNAEQTRQNLEKEGMTMVETRMGFKTMSAPTKELLRLVLNEKLAHDGHPVLRWNMDNLVVDTDPAANVKPNKEKATEKIDGAVALIMALSRVPAEKKAKPCLIVFGDDGYYSTAD